MFGDVKLRCNKLFAMTKFNLCEKIRLAVTIKAKHIKVCGWSAVDTEFESPWRLSFESLILMHTFNVLGDI